MKINLLIILILINFIKFTNFITAPKYGLIMDPHKGPIKVVKQVE